jgi:hypothetical protein
MNDDLARNLALHERTIGRPAAPDLARDDVGLFRPKLRRNWRRQERHGDERGHSPMHKSRSGFRAKDNARPNGQGTASMRSDHAALQVQVFSVQHEFLI